MTRASGYRPLDGRLDELDAIARGKSVLPLAQILLQAADVRAEELAEDERWSDPVGRAQATRDRKYATVDQSNVLSGTVHRTGTDIR